MTLMCVIPVVFLIIVRGYVWNTLSQTQQYHCVSWLLFFIILSSTLWHRAVRYVDINLSEVHLLDSTGFLASRVYLIDHPSYSLPLRANCIRSLISSTRNMKAAYISDRFIPQDFSVLLHKTSNTRYLTILLARIQLCFAFLWLFVL